MVAKGKFPCVPYRVKFLCVFAVISLVSKVGYQGNEMDCGKIVLSQRRNKRDVSRGNNETGSALVPALPVFCYE